MDSLVSGLAAKETASDPGARTAMRTVHPPTDPSTGRPTCDLPTVVGPWMLPAARGKIHARFQPRDRRASGRWP